MFDKNKLHLVPPIVQDRVDSMLASKSREAIEIYAQQIEVIRDYCQDALDRYEKLKAQKSTWKKSA